MKSIIVGLLSLLVLTACTVPSPSDFESANSPLAKNEFIAMWRIPGEGSIRESYKQEQSHLEEMDKVLQPFFQQLITQVFKDAKDGKLQIQEAEDIMDLEEKVIEDLPSRMSRRFGATYQNLKPFMGAIHIIQKRKENAKGLPGNDLELMLIEQDPEGQAPEAYFGAVKVSDLQELDYSFEIEGNTYDLSSFMDRYKEFVYPIFFKNTEREVGLRSLDQAFKMKQIVLDGEWKSIEWLNDEPNLTEHRAVKLSSNDLSRFSGTYIFKEGAGFFFNPGAKDVRVDIEAEKEHLSLSWDDGGPFYGISFFPSAKDHFFTVYGDQVSFFTEESGKAGIKYTDFNGEASIAYKQ
ncbi:MAG: hypothetical protein R8P61_23055 [Bacteroidia bacterium]|nr:hypothetical protein [Bacteroidia bacterium]